MYSQATDLLEEGEYIDDSLRPSRFSLEYLRFYLAGLGVIGLGAVVFVFRQQIGGVDALTLSTVAGGLGLLGFVVMSFGEAERMMLKYFFTDRKIIMQEGIIGKDFITIRYEEITDTTLDQTVIEGFFDVGKLQVNTPGTDDSELTLHGLKNPDKYKVKLGKAASEGRMAQDRQGQEVQQQQRQGPANPDDPRGGRRKELEAELGRIYMEKKRLERRYNNGQIGEDAYRDRWYTLQGREDQVMRQLEQSS
jgi:uncharacterized membrane protein YdbT with pleckstrin-like domain